MCPALLSNPSLRKQKAALLCDYFHNGDGVLVILLTDSGHYLLPIDHDADVSDDTKQKVQMQMFSWAESISNRWPDVRHCFL